MTTHEFALSDLAARLAGTDATLSTSLRDILTAALLSPVADQACQSGYIGAAHGTPSPQTSERPRQ